MSLFYIWEFSEILTRGNTMIGKAPGVRQQTPLSIGASPTQSLPFAAGTNYIRMHTDAVCSVDIGENPTASINTARMAANQTEYIGVNPGDSLSVIANS